MTETEYNYTSNKDRADNMKMLHISVPNHKHNKIKKSPSTDMIIHSGDFSLSIAVQEFFDFVQ